MGNLAQSLTALFFSAVSSIFGISENPHDIRVTDPAEPRVEYTCSDVKWAEGSGMKGKNFEGAVDVECKFVGTHGGGFTELNAFLLDQAVHGKEVVAVHSGPKSETYSNMPSTYFDVTTRIGNDSDVADVRQDMHIATNLADRLLLASISKSIQGSGNAKYLRKTDVIADVLSTDKPRDFVAKVRAAVVIEKPWFIPSDSFVNIIRDQVNQQAAQIEKDLITKVSQHI